MTQSFFTLVELIGTETKPVADVNHTFGPLEVLFELTEELFDAVIAFAATLILVVRFQVTLQRMTSEFFETPNSVVPRVLELKLDKSLLLPVEGHPGEMFVEFVDSLANAIPVRFQSLTESGNLLGNLHAQQFFKAFTVLGQIFILDLPADFLEG